MTYARLFFILSLSGLIQALPLLSQELPIIHYGTKEGLPSVFITSLAQGPDGRLWIAHHGGVSVYDGAEFRSWSGENGLIRGTPNAIAIDGKGALWMAFAEGGIQYIDRDGTIHSVPHPGRPDGERIANLFRMRDGSIWGSGKLGYYTISEKGIEGPLYPVKDKQDGVKYILDQGDGLGILVACADGVFSIKERIVEPFALPYEEISSREIALMARGNGEEIWFLSSNGKLIRQSNGNHRLWDLNTVKDTQNVPFYEMQVDPVGNLWIATGIGLFRWREGAIESFTEEQGLSNIWLNHLLVDQGGILWLATEGGLDKISQMAFRNYSYRKGFPVNSVWPMLEMEDGSKWIGTNSGIVIIDEDGKSRVITEKEGLPENSILDLHAAGDGKVWILSYSGIHQWDGRRFVSFPHAEFKEMDLWGILPVHPNEVWIYSSDGIFVLDPARKALTRHPITDRIEGARTLNDLVLGKDGDIFIVGKRLYVYTAGGTLEEIPLPDRLKGVPITTVVLDGERIWLVTDDGLASYKGRKWEWYPVEGKRLYSMVKVREGEYWLGCNSGISRFDGERFFFFDFHDGVAVEECNATAALVDRKGRVWLGGRNITIVQPEAIRKYPAQKPLLTRVDVSQTRYTMPGRIEFSSREKSVDIHFSSPSFYNEQEQLFRYRMKGLDPDWSAPTRDHSVRYANLSPGRYSFEVQSRQVHGDWDGPTTELELKVSPTFWQTKLAKIILIFILITSGSLFSVARVRRLEAQKVKLQLLVDEHTRQIRKQRDKMGRLATIDELTRLPNRRKFVERMEEEIARSKRTRRPLSLALFDIDQFKSVNDSCGHVAGDEILKIVAKRARRAIREIDFLARWGGDEFVFFMPETDQKHAMETCERLKAAIQSSPYLLIGRIAVECTISGGIATWNDSDGNKRNVDLFREADRALYRAKESGGNRICVA